MKAIKIFIFIFFVTQTVSAQINSEILVDDLPQWYEMFNPNVSSDGKWFSYIKSTEPKKLYLIETASDQEIVFENHHKNSFSNNGNFILIQTEDALKIGNLKTKRWESKPLKEWSGWIGATDQILWKNKDTIAKYNAASHTSQYITGLVASFVNYSANQVVYIRKEDGYFGVYVMDTHSFQAVRILQTTKNIKGVQFDSDSDDFVLAVQDEKGVRDLIVADKAHSRWNTFSLSDADKEVHWDGYTFFVDGAAKSIYFYMTTQSANTGQQEQETIRVQNSFESKPSNNNRIYHYWNYSKKKVIALHDAEMDDILVTSVPEYYIAYSKRNYDIRDNNGIERADFYLIGAEKKPVLIEKEIALTHKHFIISPNKPYILYYKDGLWWSYHLINKTKRCLNKEMPNQFENFERKYLASTTHYHLMGFSDRKNEVWLYDKNDIWVVNLDGKYAERITKGKENGMVYRHIALEGFFVNKYHDTKFRSNVITESENKPISIYNTMEEKWGLAYLDKNRNVTEIQPVESYRYLWTKFISKDQLIIKKVNNQTPGLFEIKDIKGNLIWSHQSNKELKAVGVQKAKLINVNLSDAHQTRAALFYPVNWDPKKKYPMIVYVYEKTATKITEYVPPSWSNSDGFNKSLLNHNDYFVLNVDLRYQYNQVGKYLASDINQIIDKITETEQSINSSKIGLFGHSFGGYEVMFLVGQTNRFKAAVAGAGVADLYDMYYGEKDKGSLGMFVVENVQFRTNPPYENSKFDLSNPLKYVDKITTPMFIWSGKNDHIIRKEHSIKMYLALWRQKKEATLVIYENDHHFLEDPENQKDLTLRILRFFNSKLK